MHGTTSSVRIPGAGARAEIDPAWQPWVRMLELALDAARHPAWEGAVPDAPAWAGAAAGSGVAVPPDAPLLHGATLRPESRRLRRLVRDLLRAAAESGAEGLGLTPAALRRLDALALVRAAITRDESAIERLAASAGAEPAALDVVAQLAAMPLLHACAARLRPYVSESWTQGYCPVCGAWPLVAEARGIERTRQLRCGRCAADWRTAVLRCAFCDEQRHGQLGSLLPEGQEQTRRVDVCRSCHGYLKTFATLRALPLGTLVLDDLATVELDLVAQERGYARPARPGWELALAIERPAPRRVAARRA